MSSNFLQTKKELPFLGVGLGLRRDLFDETLNSSDIIDWLEFIPENFMGVGGKARQRIKACASVFPLISHGVGLSIGSSDPLNSRYLSDLKSILDELDCPWWSDHLSFSSVNGVYLHDLLPLPFTEETVLHVVNRINEVQDFTSRPFLIENISYYMQMPNAEMRESEFISKVLEKADCGLLLDVNNVYVNSVNFQFDPFEFIDELPLERVVQIHIAGHKFCDSLIIDTHGESIVEPVYELLAHVLKKSDVRAILLERDQNFPDFPRIREELMKIHKLFNNSNNAGSVETVAGVL